MSKSFKYYQDVIPDEIAEKLNYLYKSAYCTKEYFLIFKNSDEFNTLVIYDDNVKIHILCYTITGNEAVVLNEIFPIEDEYINYFSEIVFRQHKRVNTIHFDKLNLKISTCNYPFRIWRISNDILLHLPENFEEYRAKLGKRTRTNLNYYNNKIRREFTNFSFTVQVGDEIDPSIINDIINLNRIRMKKKKISSVYDHDFKKNIIQFSSKYGMVGSIKINGKVAAGSVCYKVGNHGFAIVIAHDQDYNKYSIGTVCNFLMIQALIDKGVRTFHLESGESEYKYRLKGVRSDIYTISIFRSKMFLFFGNIRYFTKNQLVVKLKNVIKYKIIQKIINFR